MQTDEQNRTPYTRTQLREAARRVSRTWHRLVKRAGLASSRMRVPTFRLGSSRSWGSWNGATRTFTINARLAVEFGDHPEFRDTIAHELAHQFVDEVAKAKEDEPPHGPTWRAAAGLFGANPRATASCRLDALCAPTDDADARILRKVKKLLRLSESPNEHEAELAALRARELMCRHQISLAQADGGRTWDFKTLGEPRKQKPRWIHSVVSILTDFYHVEAIWLPEGDPNYDGPRTSGKRSAWLLEVTGTPSAVAVAEHVYGFLLAEGERRLAAYRADGGSTSRTARIDFLCGLYRGFYSKLEEQTAALKDSLVESSGGASAALVLVRDPQRQAFFAARHPDIGYTRVGRRTTYDGDARREGKRQGREMTVRDAVSSQSRGLALPE